MVSYTIKSRRGVQVSFYVEPNLADKLKSMAESEDRTLSNFLLSRMKRVLPLDVQEHSANKLKRDFHE